MRLFRKEESFVVFLVLAAIAVLSVYNLKIALRRSRDFQRKEDIANIAQALFAYHEDFGFYPESSSEGKIVACTDSPHEELRVMTASELVKNLRPCSWWYDGLSNFFEETVYLKQIPGDPRTQDGYAYRYIATRDHFQIFASFEGADEDEYDDKVYARSLICGVATCNFGRSSPNTPLDKSLEEYENELKSVDGRL